MEFLNKCNTCKNKYHSHYQCANYSPKKNFVLIFSGHFEVGKYEYKNKDIVDTQRFLNQVTGQKFQCPFLSKKMINSIIKNQRKCHPYTCPNKSFFNFNLMRLAVKHS